jgi:hypothetical protein
MAVNTDTGSNLRADVSLLNDDLEEEDDEDEDEVFVSSSYIPSLLPA